MENFGGSVCGYDPRLCIVMYIRGDLHVVDVILCAYKIPLYSHIITASSLGMCNNNLYSK